LLHPTPKV